MPKATVAGRQVARFEDGELRCGDDAAPPVSPAGWYFRPGGASVPWIGPFPTAEAARVARCGGDPVAAARRRLDEWARAAEAEPGPGPEARVSRNGAAVRAPSAGNRRSRLDAPAAPPEATGSRRRAGSDGIGGANVEVGEALAPATACTLARAPGPSPPRHGRVAVGGPGPGPEDAGAPSTAPSAPRQLAFGFGSGAEAAAVEPGSEARPASRRRPSKRRGRTPAAQGALPF